MYDWQYDDDDDTYILITYPDPLDWKSYSTTVDYEVPETAPSDNKCCDHTGIIAVLEEIRDKMVAGFTDITANIHTDMVDFKAAVVAGFTDITTNITQW